MDVLVKKSDSSVVETFAGGAAKIQLPGAGGSDSIFVGGTPPKRPMDLGDYLLVTASEVYDDIAPGFKRGPTTTDVDVQAQTVTITHTTVAMTEADFRAEIIPTIKSDMSAKIDTGILWAWSSGEIQYAISIDQEMRELLSYFHQLIASGNADPHGGFIKSNGVKIYGLGGIDLPDAAVSEIAEFGALWALEIYRVGIAQEAAVNGMDLTALQGYNTANINWMITWIGHADWTDNLVYYNPA